MTWIKIEYQETQKKVVKEYADKKSARADFAKLKTGQHIINVKDVKQYKESLNDLNLILSTSQSILMSNDSEENVIHAINPFEIDESKVDYKSRLLILTAMDTDKDDDWFKVMNAHNAQKWSMNHMCCNGHLNKLKSIVIKMIDKHGVEFFKHT
jgi:hypothetical protein